MLKDVLAFANAWRRSEAYIVIGAKEIVGDKAKITGINENIDDAQLQQFVNSKVNKPIEFSYQTSEFDGLKVALITIAVQARPIFLKKNFGRLSANAVYLRRGSSTDIASPEEIAKMGVSDLGRASEIPVISTFFVSGKHDEMRSNEHSDNVKIVEIPPLSEFPSYSSVNRDEPSSYEIIGGSLYGDNPDFYKELAKYIQQTSRASFLKFGVENLGNRVAHDVRAVLEFNALPAETELVCSRDLLKVPVKQQRLIDPKLNLENYIYKTGVSKTSTGYKVEIDFGKVQAKDSKNCDEPICILASRELQTKVKVKVFSDDLPEPSLSELLINISSEHKKTDVSDFMGL